MPRTKQAEMTAAELVAARQVLGWDRDRMADGLGLLPANLDACEAGLLPVPPDKAWLVRTLLQAKEQRPVLEARGLLECPRGSALRKAFDAAMDRGVQAAGEARDAVLAHDRTCHVCSARKAYLQGHAPPPPEPGTGWFGGVATALKALTRPLSGLLRPPAGPRGEHRRGFVVITAILTGAVLVGTGMALVLRLVVGDAGSADVQAWLKLMAVVVITYFVGGMLAGAAWDATRGIRHRLIGYMARGGATAAAVYGAAGLALPFIEEETISPSEFPAVVALLTVLGVLFGLAKWVKDRISGDLPDPPRG